MITLEKTMSVLDLQSFGEEAAIYDNSADDGQVAGRTRQLMIDRATYDALGKPLVVTVTIEPRDAFTTAEA